MGAPAASPQEPSITYPPCFFAMSGNHDTTAVVAITTVEDMTSFLNKFLCTLSGSRGWRTASPAPRRLIPPMSRLPSSFCGEVRKKKTIHTANTGRVYRATDPNCPQMTSDRPLTANSISATPLFLLKTSSVQFDEFKSIADTSSIDSTRRQTPLVSVQIVNNSLENLEPPPANAKAAMSSSPTSSRKKHITVNAEDPGTPPRACCGQPDYSVEDRKHIDVEDMRDWDGLPAHVQRLLRRGSPSTRGVHSLHPLSLVTWREPPPFDGPPRYLRSRGITPVSNRPSSQFKTPKSERRVRSSGRGQRSHCHRHRHASSRRSGPPESSTRRRYGRGERRRSGSRHRRSTASRRSHSRHLLDDQRRNRRWTILAPNESELTDLMSTNEQQFPRNFHDATAPQSHWSNVVHLGDPYLHPALPFAMDRPSAVASPPPDGAVGVTALSHHKCQPGAHRSQGRRSGCQDGDTPSIDMPRLSHTSSECRRYGSVWQVPSTAASWLPRSFPAEDAVCNSSELPSAAAEGDGTHQYVSNPQQQDWRPSASHGELQRSEQRTCQRDPSCSSGVIRDQRSPGEIKGEPIVSVRDPRPQDASAPEWLCGSIPLRATPFANKAHDTHQSTAAEPRHSHSMGGVLFRKPKAVSQSEGDGEGPMCTPGGFKPRPHVLPKRDAWEAAAAERVLAALEAVTHMVKDSMTGVDRSEAPTPLQHSPTVLTYTVIVSRPAEAALNGKAWSGDVRLPTTGVTGREPCVIHISIPRSNLASAKIADVKREVARQINVPVEYQRIRVEGVQLSDSLPMNLLEPTSVMFLDVFDAAPVSEVTAQTAGRLLTSPRPSRLAPQQEQVPDAGISCHQAAQEHLARSQRILWREGGRVATDSFETNSSAYPPKERTPSRGAPPAPASTLSSSSSGKSNVGRMCHHHGTRAWMDARGRGSLVDRPRTASNPNPSMPSCTADTSDNATNSNLKKICLHTKLRGRVNSEVAWPDALTPRLVSTITIPQNGTSILQPQSHNSASPAGLDIASSKKYSAPAAKPISHGERLSLALQRGYDA